MDHELTIVSYWMQDNSSGLAVYCACDPKRPLLDKPDDGQISLTEITKLGYRHVRESDREEK